MYCNVSIGPTVLPSEASIYARLQQQSQRPKGKPDSFLLPSLSTIVLLILKVYMV